MKKGDVIYWAYKGFPSDEYASGKAKLLDVIPGSKSRAFKATGWYTQLGFGPGYYNNSWVYKTYVKSTLTRDLTTEEVAALDEHFKQRSYAFFRYADEQTFTQKREDTSKHARLMKKRHPY